MKIVTFNLNCCWDGAEGINSFIHRAGMIYERINAETPDIMAFQEVVPKSIAFLRRILPEYDFYGHFRTKNFDVEGLYTAVRKDTFDVMAYETFWLSPNPYEPGSRFEKQSECPRICVLTDIRDKRNGFRLRLFNVHLDHISDCARALGIQCVLRKVEEYNKRKSVYTGILGDFNALPGSEPIEICEKFGFFDAASAQNCTFHDLGKRKEKLDYIFLSEDMRGIVKNSFAWNDFKNGIYLSDHYPVGIILEVTK